MHFKFKIQPYQTAAAKAVADVFAGQPNSGAAVYLRDLGRGATKNGMEAFAGFEAQLEARTGNIEFARTEFFLTMCMEPRATFAKCMREDDFGIEQRARDADVGDHLGAITQPGINFQCFGL